MYARNMIEVETLPTSIRVTIPNDEVDAGRLDEVLRWLRLESVSRRSAMTEQDAEEMAESAKAEWWAKNKSRFLPEQV